MKIAVFSDTHGNTARMAEAVRRCRPDALIHLGDLERDTEILRREFPEIPLYNVCGNCDAMRGPVEAKPDCYLRLEGFKVWITHGHLYMNETRQIAELAHWGQELEQDIVIFGHTHVPVFTQMNGIWLLNPGSPSRPREGSRAGFVILTLNQGQMPAVEFLEV